MNKNANHTRPLRLVTPQMGRNAENDYRHELAVQNLIKIRDYATERLAALNEIDRNDPLAYVQITGRLTAIVETIIDTADVALRFATPIPGLDDLGDDDYVGDFGGAA